ncbi:MAG: hypothetical protein ACLFWL_08340 [Candidatus Brocadiia bacterium]
MCEECGCQDEEKKVENPEECSPEQVEECHGDEEGHPCVDEGCHK